MSRIIRAFVCGLVVCGVALCARAWGVDDFTFLHLSDCHFPHAADQTRETVGAIPTTGPIRLAPTGAVFSEPAFAFVTGDLTEFGGGSEWWDGYLRLWSRLPFPIYHLLGNHDNTWDCGRPWLRKIHGAVFYAFEYGGCRFISWDTATPQDPRPSIATEGLLWLEKEFERTPLDQPVFFFCHHPLDGREFASDYDRWRLLDLLRSRNVVLLLVGHGHGRRAWQIEGLNAVMGGSTFGDKRGFGVVSIKDGVLRVRHQMIAPQPKAIAQLEKPIPPRSPFLNVTSVKPPDGAVFESEDPLEWAARLDASDGATTGRWTLDEKTKGEMRLEDGAWRARVGEKGLAAGAHTIRFEFFGSNNRTGGRSIAFWIDADPFRIAWKRRLPGSCQSTPTVSDGRLFVGADDGALHAFEAATGRLLWRYETGGEVRSQPVMVDDGEIVCVGSADGSLYGLGVDGVLRWRFDAGAAVYASPLAVGRRVVCGTNSGDVVALDAATGALLWRSTAPEYAIEVRPCAAAETVAIGAWDCFIYSFALADGATRWRMPSHGSDRKAAARYYSPADCGPALAQDALFVADRAYDLTILDADTGQRRATESKCAAVSSSADGRHVYLRHTDNRVSKRRADGAAIWTTAVPTGSIPNAPVEAGGYVWTLSNTGVLTVLDAESGKAVGQIRASPGLYAFASPAFDGSRAYVVNAAGDLLAFAPTWLAKP